MRKTIFNKNTMNILALIGLAAFGAGQAMASDVIEYFKPLRQVVALESSADSIRLKSIKVNPKVVVERRAVPVYNCQDDGPCPDAYDHEKYVTLVEAEIEYTALQRYFSSDEYDNNESGYVRAKKSLTLRLEPSNFSKAELDQIQATRKHKKENLALANQLLKLEAIGIPAEAFTVESYTDRGQTQTVYRNRGERSLYIRIVKR